MWRAGDIVATRRRRGWLALALAMALPALPQAAEAQRRRRPFLVEELPARLVIRQEPRPTARPVGQIPAAARGLIASGRRQRLGRSLWHEVQYHGVRGWVNAPALPPDRPAPPVEAEREGTVFVEDLVCLGRSPDWKLVIDRDGTVACTDGCASPAPLRALPAQPEKGRKGSWRMAIRDPQGNDVMLVSVRYAGCQDVAGDRYAYRVSTLAADGTRQSGCCNRTGGR